MTTQTQDSKTVTEVLPEKKQLPLAGLYLSQGLAQISAQMQKTLVLTTYVTDRNGVVAKADEQHHFHVPAETRNESDWRLSQELMAQADVLITGGDYLRSVSNNGKHRQDVLYQFEPGGEFEDLGEWRLSEGYEKRSPDVAVLTHRVDFKIPKKLLGNGRRITVFTTDEMAKSEGAKALIASGVAVIGSGKKGVDGQVMTSHLSHDMGARVIMSTTGPHVLQLLLAARRLDLLYLTQVQTEIPHNGPKSVKTLLPDGKRAQDLKELHLTHEYRQEHAVAGDGSEVSQLFVRYDRVAQSHLGAFVREASSPG